MEETLTPLVAAAAEADHARGITPQAFEQVVRLHQRRIYRVLLALVRDSDAAETLTQECFLRAYRKRTNFRGEASVDTWLIRIAINLARDHARNRRLAFWRGLFGGTNAEDQTGAGREVPDPRASPERALIAGEELAGVWSVVNRLSPQQRATFLLRFGEELTLEEIAEAMRLRVGTVKSHLSRAVGAVRKYVKEQKEKCKDI